MVRDLICGLMGLAIAFVYLSAAAEIPASALGDSVGAAGFPRLLGYALALVSAVFVIYRLVTIRRGSASNEAAPTEGVFAAPREAFLSAAGTAAICGAFILLFEPAGYLLSIALLIFGLCMYQGVKPGPRLVAIAAGGSFVLWLLFAQLLSVRMPAGFWADLI